MDVFWASAAVWTLPSSQRVEVIVHDGTTDLRLWPGPGADRELLTAYGPNLKEVLAEHRERIGRDLEPGEVVRFHPGKLHCNYLLWVALSGPEENAERAPAADAELIERSTRAALEYAGERRSASVGFGALGDGPGALDPEERLAIIVRAASEYRDECFEAGRGTGVEIVRVCEPSNAIATRARRLVGKLATPEQPAPPPKTADDPPPRRRTAASGSKTTARKPRTPRVKGLDPDEIALQRTRAPAYDRTITYEAGSWIIHPRFGVGLVDEVTPEGAIQVRFEDGSSRKMLHGRS